VRLSIPIVVVSKDVLSGERYLEESRERETTLAGPDYREDQATLAFLFFENTRVRGGWPNLSDLITIGRPSETGKDRTCKL